MALHAGVESTLRTPSQGDYGFRLGGRTAADGAQDFHDLRKWSCDRRGQFYGQLWDSQRWIHQGSFERVVDETVPIDRLPRWFAGVRLNWAENLLWTRGPDGADTRSTLHKEDGRTAVTEVREGGRDVVDVTWAELRASVARLAAAMHARGVAEGDRVVMVGAHACQTLVVFLATVWLGAVFSSSSTDMGVAGLLQRTAQIDPKVRTFVSPPLPLLVLVIPLTLGQFIFFDDAALYNAKVVDLRDKIRGVVDGMQGCSAFEKVVVVERFAREPRDTSDVARTERLEQFLQAAPADAPPPPIRRIGFQDPLIIYYSSGTTGTPKAIVHGVGPLLMNAAKEGTLHFDMTPDDVGLQYTTTGWIMFLVSVASLVIGARAVLYDGSPFAPDPAVLLRVARQQRVSVLGVSPRWMTELMKRDIAPRDMVDLSSLRVVTSTGMVLPDQLFLWFYDRAFPAHVQLANMSGGTDIVRTGRGRRRVFRLALTR